MTRPFRRRVLYLPGFDPIPPRRYRELYRREGAEQARISGHELSMLPTGPDPQRFSWGVASRMGDAEAETRIEVLVWSDIVQASMRAGIPGTYAQLLRTAWTYIATGTLTRLMRLRRGPVIAALYPIAVLSAQFLLAVLAGLLTAWAVAALAGIWAGLVAGLAAFCGILILGRRLDHRLFAYYLMHDYAFTAAHRGAYPPALEERLAQFRARLTEVLDEDLDEVLVVGHSSGAYLAVSLLADLLRHGRPAGPDLSLLTLGHVIPMAAFLPDAKCLREDLAWLSRREDIFWLDVTAPGDACCFALCDPVAVCGAGGKGQLWPLVISAAYTQTLSPEKQREIRNRWFRLHFQYLCAFDRPGDYDYFAITAGPQTLAQRFTGRKPSPGRITRPVGARP
ncbi:hypothetical protein KY389_09610 [Paracoccus bogoriensis]|uniref:hypothetical protein n=1 Tax=Paracoccus bogoriensis TaxID=242065 RepID=UPI001CA51369|nr:hypothetical protein [Paracoccus bogoriensis]MBW7056950.1 hypothetical protein [Paracoccus bogoriensis]